MPARFWSGWRVSLFAPLLAACAAHPSEHLAGAPTSISVVMTEGTNMSAALSPDGRSIAASIQGTLWSLSASGGRATALTAPELDAQEPAWSPDSKLIAFYAFADDAWSVWTVGADGSGLIKRSQGLGDARYPTFTPDGKSLVYSVDGEGYSIVRHDLSSGGDNNAREIARRWLCRADGRLFPEIGKRRLSHDIAGWRRDRVCCRRSN
ncbi:MAG: PD40 domain-containing protein [Hyphomonadaceae bacterium]|nr:PD40 domain-containing protein [Hyphomonadaceae bacterium]